MKRMLMAITSTLLVGGGAAAFAQYVSGEVGLVTRLRTYQGYGNGDVLIWVQNSISPCDGFWFQTSEPNGKEMFAQLLASQRTQTTVYIAGHADRVWPGSTSRFCRIYSLDTTSS